MKILNFASSNVDMVYSVDHITLPGETLAAAVLETFPGGKGLNQSIALSRAGAQVYHAGCIGQDGQMLTDILKSCGADLRYLKIVEEKTGHAIIQVDKHAENCIIIYHGANYCVTCDHIDSVLADFGKDDFLMTQNEISNVSYLIQAASDKGMQVVFNPSPYHEDLKKIPLQHIRWLILNETEAEGLFSTKDPLTIQQLLQTQYPHLSVLLTLGRSGSVIIDTARIHYQHAFVVTSVDTTAAGDTYTGFFIAELSRGQSAEDAMQVASAASAIAVSRKGASSSIPTMEEVKVQLDEMVQYPSCDRRIQTAKDFFENHYADGNVGMLAKELGYSPTYTSTWLKDQLHFSFTDLLQMKRAEIGAKLLADSQLSVTEIINMVGYTNETQFRRVFQQIYGCSPLKYRKSKKG